MPTARVTATVEDPPVTPNPPHDQCPDAASAEELQALVDHLAKYTAPDPLANHLRKSHHQHIRWDMEQMTELRRLHQAAHPGAAESAQGGPATDTQE